MNGSIHRWFFLVGGLSSLLFASIVAADDWPQWRGPLRDGVWREDRIIERFKTPEVPILWRAEIGAGYSGPTIANGRVYVTDRLDEPEQIERTLCFDAASGKLLWKHQYACLYTIGYKAGPRACVTVQEGRAYALGAMGHFFCYRADSGEPLWQHDLAKQYRIRMPIWGIAAAPLIEKDTVILQVGGENACLVAFDKLTGVERWRALDDRASYAAPIIIEQAGQRVLVCLTGDNVVGLEPTTGKLHWSQPFRPRNMPIGISTPIVEGDRLFVTSFYDGGLMLRLDQKQPHAHEVWRRVGKSERDTDSLQSIMSTPVFKGNYLYGADSYGELRCLLADTGDRVWEDTTAVPKARWANIHFVRHGDEYWLFNERGELIIADLSPAGFSERSRAKLIAPTLPQLNQRGGVCWSHPAFALRRVFARNDHELVCGDLEQK